MLVNAVSLSLMFFFAVSIVFYSMAEAEWKVEADAGFPNYETESRMTHFEQPINWQETIDTALRKCHERWGSVPQQQYGGRLKSSYNVESNDSENDLILTNTQQRPTVESSHMPATKRSVIFYPCTQPQFKSSDVHTGRRTRHSRVMNSGSMVDQNCVFFIFNLH